MIYPTITKKDRSFSKVVTLNLSKEVKQKIMICKGCGFPNSRDDLKIVKEFWHCCSCGKSNKLNIKDEKTISKYHINMDSYINKVEEKLKESGIHFSRYYDEFVLNTLKGKIPLVFLEFASSSTLIEALETNSIIIYYSDRLKKNVENVITKNNFLPYSDFITFSKDQVTEIVSTLSQDYSEPKIISIKSRISCFAEKRNGKSLR